MKDFEDDLIKMVENVKFRKINNEFLTTLKSDMKRINSSPNVFMLAGKSRNIYECTPTDYEKILKENVTKTYKIGSENMIDDVNSELQTISSDLSISDRIETMARKEAFVIVKDHKENFETNPKYRLINPAKSELGKVSKVILDEINERIRDATGYHQWKNSLSVIDWFEKISDKRNHSFLSFDIAEFCLSISEDLLGSTGLRTLQSFLANISQLLNTRVNPY